MKTTISITSNWQVHIPKSVREQLGINKPTQATLELAGESIVIKPKKSKFLSSAGMLHKDYKKKKIDLDNIRDHIDYSNI